MISEPITNCIRNISQHKIYLVHTIQYFFINNTMLEKVQLALLGCTDFTLAIVFVMFGGGF